MNSNRKVYLVGGGIGSLSAAAFLIRDGKIPGSRISILEEAPILGGCLDGAGDPETGYRLRGGRMLTTDNYECTWDLYKSIPSLTASGTVFDEIVAFNEKHPSHSMARLVDRRRAKVPVSSMGFSMQDRLELLRLCTTDEKVLEGTRITDWLSPSFFETAFWSMWVTTFAFQPWHSAIELKRYFHRFMLEFSRIETLAGVKRTVYNQYDSLVRPLQAWLQKGGVHFIVRSTVVDLDYETQDGKLVVTGLHCEREGRAEYLAVGEGDLVFVQNGSMVDASSFGSMTSAPVKLTRADSMSWHLWEKLAAGRSDFGNPKAFNSAIAQSFWESFTVTVKSSAFFDEMTKFSGNEPGTGGLVTFRDSNWLMSIVLYHQPHFIDQPAGIFVFWGYALFPDRIGNFVAKPMAECSGQEIVHELLGHLRFEPETLEGAICIPCRMPFITSMFMPRLQSDRPLPVPKASKNLAFVSQFVEIPDEVVFTVEFSIRAAQTAVYQLLEIDREVPRISPHDKALKTQLEALIKAFR
ncbi:MAG: oleate hydratase [Burkholderiaceae bacterium]